ncbi:MAG: NAD-dependent epimerase/dehydratase family protein [Burkholderiales bacterium]|nr:NAD-dependent epimerase/dehydratase family protein [Burkholderiales bacterium]
MRTLVTGGSGHLGFNLVALLLSRGHEVGTTLRALSNRSQVDRVRSLGPVALFEADVRDYAQMHAALANVEVLFHVAAVYSITDRSSEREVLETALAGTESTLRAAAARGVRRVVMTSSVVTLPLTPPCAPASTEEEWNTDLGIPYFRAKVESERKAWALAKELGLELTTILPAGIIGPGFVRPTPTINIIQACVMGEFRMGAPNGNFSFVDVRDVAEAHLLAAKPGATGRFIIGYDHAPSFDELVRAIGRLDRHVKPPLMILPTFAAPLLPLYDAFSHRVFGTPRIATPEAIAATVSGKVYNFSSERAKRDLAWSPKVSFEQSLRDTLVEIRRLQ